MEGYDDSMEDEGEAAQLLRFGDRPPLLNSSTSYPQLLSSGSLNRNPKMKAIIHRVTKNCSKLARAANDLSPRLHGIDMLVSVKKRFGVVRKGRTPGQEGNEDTASCPTPTISHTCSSEYSEEGEIEQARLEEFVPTELFQDCIGIPEENKESESLAEQLRVFNCLYRRSPKSLAEPCLPAPKMVRAVNEPNSSQVVQDQLSSMKEVLVKHTPELQQLLVTKNVDSRHRLAPLNVNRKLFAEEDFPTIQVYQHADKPLCNEGLDKTKQDLVHSEAKNIWNSAILILFCALLALCSSVLIFSTIDGTSIMVSLYESRNNIIHLGTTVADWYGNGMQVICSNVRCKIFPGWSSPSTHSDSDRDCSGEDNSKVHVSLPVGRSLTIPCLLNNSSKKFRETLNRLCFIVHFLFPCPSALRPPLPLIFLVSLPPPWPTAPILLGSPPSTR